MNYDYQVPIAVFLGPSLPHHEAKQILEANYYPPIRKGDIYKLLGSGVKTIIIIDGLFHAAPSVWQREILEAIHRGINVIGASSMGALRAAELYLYGMIGHGTIFEWYRDGVIDGDDEVALYHKDELRNFEPLSEPLVNIRYNLMQAVKLDYISEQDVIDLISYAKDFCYSERSYDLLFESEIMKQWTAEKIENLITFINSKKIDLKRQDTIQALKLGSTELRGKKQQIFFSEEVANNLEVSLWNFKNSLERGFLHPNSHLVPAEKVLKKVIEDSSLITDICLKSTQEYYLLQWIKQKQLICPNDYIKNYQEQWKKTYITSDYLQWLKNNSLTEQEFELKLKNQATVKWLSEQEPDDFGIDFHKYVQFFRNLQSINPELEEKYEQLMEKTKFSLYMSSWAKSQGISCPSAEAEKYINIWQEEELVQNIQNNLKSIKDGEEIYSELLHQKVLTEWILQKSPAYFGYSSWNPYAEILKELQITGQASVIVKSI